MRPYPTNSPEAAARLVLICALADGVLGADELEVLERQRVPARLGLTAARFRVVVADLLEDLGTPQRRSADVIELGPRVVGRLMAEVDRRDLQRTVVGLIERIAHADDLLAGGEEALIATVRIRWQLDAPTPATRAPTAGRSPAHGAAPCAN